MRASAGINISLGRRTGSLDSRLLRLRLETKQFNQEAEKKHFNLLIAGFVCLLVPLFCPVCPELLQLHQKTHPHWWGCLDPPASKRETTRLSRLNLKFMWHLGWFLQSLYLIIGTTKVWLWLQLVERWFITLLYSPPLLHFLRAQKSSINKQ